MRGTCIISRVPTDRPWATRDAIVGPRSWLAPACLHRTCTMTRILIVDDEPTLVELLDGYLRHEGYDVVVAADGPDAVRRAQETQPDLIILDVLLPGFDGIEACRQIRRFSDAYVLMLTARTEEIDKIVGLTVGADDYVTKPFSPREVVARVKVLLRRPRNQTSALAAGAEG